MYLFVFGRQLWPVSQDGAGNFFMKLQGATRCRKRATLEPRVADPRIRTIDEGGSKVSGHFPSTLSTLPSFNCDSFQSAMMILYKMLQCVCENYLSGLRFHAKLILGCLEGPSFEHSVAQLFNTAAIGVGFQLL